MENLDKGDVMGNLLKKLDGWKTILSYIFAQVFGSYPLLLTAGKELLTDYKNPEKIINFLIQLGLALGLSHKALKNLKKSY